MKKRFLTIALSASIVVSAYAIPAYKGLITRTMPDGSTIEILLHGDENFHYATLADGTIIKEKEGQFYYATIGDDGVEATRYKVGQTLPSKAKLFTTNDNSTVQKLSEIYNNHRIRRNAIRQNADKGDTPIGSQHGLVILVNFSDVQLEYDKQMFVDVLNTQGYNEEYATGSAYDYFRDSSYGKYSPVFDVLGPYTLSKESSYYGGNDSYGNDLYPGEMIVEACKLASADGNDMSQYDYDGDGYIDNVYVFYAGEGEANGGAAETIWPHRWVVYPGRNGNFNGTLEDTKVDGVYVYDYACSNEICESYRNSINSAFDGVGTFIHEFGHVLDLPDLYNTSYYPGAFFTLEGNDVMDSGSYLHYSRTPPAYSGYERMFMGWLSPEQIFPSYEGDEMELTPISEGKIYLLTTDGAEHNLDGANPSPAEFYLLEYRDGTGWDTYTGQMSSYFDTNVPGDKGLLITRIKYNEYRWENNEVNNYQNNMGVSYVYNDAQSRYPSTYYPMFPGQREQSSVEFGNYTVSNIHYDETSGNIRFTISDKTAEPKAGIADATASSATVTGGIGRITINGNASVEVVNMQGAIIYSGNATEIAVAPGIYIVRLTEADGTNSIQKIAVK